LLVAFSNKKILNIDKYFACETRDIQSDESGTYIILLKFKTILSSALRPISMETLAEIKL
jgi:hypothetical protein